MRKVLSCCFILLLLGNLATAQLFYRFQSEISIKEKIDSVSSLVMGDAYYDLNIGKVVYKVRFPHKETWLFKDSLIYAIQGDSLKYSHKAAPIAESTIFHLCLTGKLENFGLDGRVLQAEETEEVDGKIVTTYLPKEDYKSIFGKVIISRKAGRLDAVVFYNPQGDLLGKQYFKDYIIENGLAVPQKVVQLNYIKEEALAKMRQLNQDGEAKLEKSEKTDEGKGDKIYTHYRIISFKNIKINAPGSEEIYDYPIPR